MKGNNEMGTTLLFIVGVCALVAAVWIYSGKEDNSYEKVREGVNDIRSNALTKEDLTAALKDLERFCSDAIEARYPMFKMDVDKATELAERVRKDQDFMKVQLHTIDKRLAGQTKTLKLEINRPVPVEIISMPVKKPAPPPKESLLKKAGLKP